MAVVSRFRPQVPPPQGHRSGVCPSPGQAALSWLLGAPKSKERYARFVAELSAQRTPIVAATDRASITVVEAAGSYLDFAEGY